jgi:gliding motility-associated-like protein
VAYGVNGCNDTTSYKFRVSDSSSISLPNIFTPNGDGANDVYIPITRGISGLNAWVYNRDGVIVSNWDKPRGGWDGYSTSGEPCSDGVYYIVVNAFGFDGKVYKLKSSITLIR